MPDESKEPSWLWGYFFLLRPAGIQPVRRWLVFAVGVSLIAVAIVFAFDTNSVALRHDRLEVQQADSASTRGGATLGAFADLIISFLRYPAYAWFMLLGAFGAWLLVSVVTRRRWPPWFAMAGAIAALVWELSP